MSSSDVHLGRKSSGPSHPLTRREARPQGTRISLGAAEIGGRDFVVIAGPCAVESAAQLESAAQMVAAAGAPLLRAGAYKPRTSPYSFQGLGKHGLKMLNDCGRRFGLPVVTEVLSPEDVPVVERHTDVLQVGTRNMHNYALLQALGHARKPVLLKRGLAATIEEWLYAAEYILHAGNPQVILCERGIRTFETLTRNTLDLNAVALVKRLTHLPVLVDPSHGTGRRELVRPLTLAALAAGADGVLIEAHPEPEKALSDGAQSLNGPELDALIRDLGRLAPLHGRRLPTAPATGEAHIHNYRRRIDDLDQTLIACLSERARLGKLLGEAKHQSGRPLRDATREQEVLARASAGAGDGLSADALARVFQCIMAETRRVQERTFK